METKKRNISGKEKSRSSGRLEETVVRCGEPSLQEEDQLRRRPQHWRPLRLHGDLGAHGVPGWIPLGGLSLLEQALPGFLAINSKQKEPPY